MKIINACFAKKEETLFSPCMRKSDTGACRECSSKNSKKYFMANKEEIKQSKKDYYETYKEDLQERNRQYYQAHKTYRKTPEKSPSIANLHLLMCHLQIWNECETRL